MSDTKKTETVKVVDNQPGALAPSANVPGPGMAPADMDDTNTPDTGDDDGVPGGVYSEPDPKAKK